MTIAKLFYNPVIQLFNNSGSVLAGGYIYFYAAGSTTPKDTYTTSAKSVPNPNPITLDTAGRPDNSGSPIQIWLDGAYKILVKDSTGATIRTEDNVTTLSQLFASVTKSTDYTVVETDQNSLIMVDASSGNRTITLLPATTAGSGFLIGVKKIDASTNSVIVDGYSAELINDNATLPLLLEEDATWLMCTGIGWEEWSHKGTVLDSNNNEVLKFVETAAAVNEISITNAATTTSPTISSTGGDTNIGLKINTKGTGTLAITGTTTLSGTQSITIDDATTGGNTDVLTLAHTTSGTPATNIATGILFQTESADEVPSNMGRLSFITTDVTAGSEDSKFTIQNRVAGAALTDAYTFINTGGFSYTYTGAPTAARTITLPNTDLSNHLLQIVRASTNTSASTATTIPNDDTIPQNTEGAEILTATITPKLSTSILEIEFSGWFTMSAAGTVTVACFQDTTANALQAVSGSPSAANFTVPISLRYYMTSGTTSATTFKIRFGPNGSTGYFLSTSGGDYYSTSTTGAIIIKEYVS